MKNIKNHIAVGTKRLKINIDSEADYTGASNEIFLNLQYLQ